MAALRFKVGGEALALEPTLNLLQDADRKKRKAAAEALAKTFKENLRLFTLVTNTLAKDKEISDRWRGFERRRAMRAISPTASSPRWWRRWSSAVRAAYPRLSHRYYALKAQLVRQEAAAALGPQRAAAEGRDAHHRLGRGAATPCSPPMARSRRRWRRSPSASSTSAGSTRRCGPGKAPGAFAHPTVPSAHPYVLLNYQGKPRDVMTLAHELGHGVHQVLAAPNGPLMAPTPLTLAETASVFGEMLTFKQAARPTTTDKKQRKAMLAAKVEDMINTVVRQIAFYTLRAQASTSSARNGELTAEQLCEIWLEVQRESLGPAIELRPGYETFWTYIPHFIHSPFYVYAYAFGDCLVNSLYAVYEQRQRGLRRALSRDARGRRHQAPFRTARAVRPRRPRSGVLAGRPGRDRAA